MIPSTFPEQTPRGEGFVFDKLQRDPATKDWVAFHSLDIKRIVSKAEGELDFVVLVPGLGVLCIEVKGSDVRRAEGKWEYGYKTDSLGPFKQASTAMHALRRWLGERESFTRNMVFFSVVVFTAIEFDEKSPEWHPWQFVNSKQLRSNPISLILTNILRKVHEHLRHHSNWYKESDCRVGAAEVDKLIQLLRPDFDYPISLRSDFERHEASIQRFTEEQFRGLDLLEENDRVIFKGFAGTGKTLLAIEAVRRAEARGVKTLFVCFNKNLSSWLQLQIQNLKLNGNLVTCSTFHKFLLDFCNKNPGSSQKSTFWKNDLPDQAIEQLLDDKRPSTQFDLIVVDEAQDLLAEKYLDVMDLLLRGGIAGGKWAMFGDFTRQALYADEEEATGDGLLKQLTRRSPHIVQSRLTVNCRNAVRVAETLEIASALRPGYSAYLNDSVVGQADSYFYASSEDQSSQLVKILGELLKVYRPEEIVVLSTRASPKSAAGTLLLRRKLQLHELTDAPSTHSVSYTSIHSYKGLESPVVILTDIEDLSGEKAKSLLYVGMSRARVTLIMLMSNTCRQQYRELLDLGL